MVPYQVSLITPKEMPEERWAKEKAESLSKYSLRNIWAGQPIKNEESEDNIEEWWYKRESDTNT